MLKSTRALIAVFGTFLVAPVWASTCDVGFAVTFFNGVANTLQDADSSKFATRTAIQETFGTGFDVYDSQPISYDVGYNTTQGTVQDVFEVFVQRANQIDSSGNFENQFGYLYWAFLANTSQNYPGTISAALPTSLSAVASTIAAWPQATAGIIATNLANQLNTAPTTADTALQQATLTADANNGRLQLLVAHSQGNLFVDSANVFLSQSGLVTQGQYSTVHVAPATSILYGPYLLSSHDLVINGLGLLAGGISPANIFLPFTLTDPTGHGYQEIYLNAGLTDSQSGLSARALLEGLFRDALRSLDSQQCQLQVSGAATAAPGDSVPLTATLTPALSPSLDPNHITIKYKWTIYGDVGGTFTDPLTGGLVPSVVTTVPNVSYHAYNAVQSGQPGTDQVSVEVDVSTPDNGAATTKVLATGATTSITVGLLNGCYDPNTVVNQPGARYSVTFADGSPGPTIGTIQQNYTTVGNVAFADPPYTNTAFEVDEMEVLSYPGFPNQNATNRIATFGSVPNSPAYVIYGSNETSTTSGGTSTLNLLTIPPVPFGQVALLLPGGPAITLLYAGTGTNTTTNSNGSTTTTVGASYTEAWSLLSTPTIHIPAGTFKTCAFKIVSSISPNIVDTKYKLYGYGIDVQETTADTSSGTPVQQDSRQATAVTINGMPYTGP